MNNHELRFGYTLQRLDHLVWIAITRRIAYADIDPEERYAAGWHAAVELLYTADEAPTTDELIYAAWSAADHDTARTAAHRGHGQDGEMPKFWAYWNRETLITRSPEGLVVDRLALAQIWLRLAPTHREALETLAALGGYRASADALGLSYQAFVLRIQRARRSFLRLWLEGETPGPRWRDRRIQTPGGKRKSLSHHVRRRARSGAAA
jgi:hypothetical protein